MAAGAAPPGLVLHEDPATACSGCLAAVRLAALLLGGPADQLAELVGAEAVAAAAELPPRAGRRGLAGAVVGAVCGSPLARRLRRRVGWDGLGRLQLDAVPNFRPHRPADPAWGQVCGRLVADHREAFVAALHGGGDPRLLCVERTGACREGPGAWGHRWRGSLRAFRADPLLLARLLPLALILLALPCVLYSCFADPHRPRAREKREEKRE